jgi:hypothetical protein
MLGRSVGVILLASALFVAGLAGIAAVWVAWPRSSMTSALMALFALVWSAMDMTTAVLTWRRSRLAGPALLGGITTAVPAKYLVPGSQLFVPSLVVIALVAFAGYRHLRTGPELAG